MNDTDKEIQAALIRVVRLSWEITQTIGDTSARLALINSAEAELTSVRRLIMRSAAA